MGLIRKPFQGVFNIVRFNWHFYLFALIALIVAISVMDILPQSMRVFCLSGIVLAIITVLGSLSVSYFIYDISDLYQLPWLHQSQKERPLRILNVNAGFDETSSRIEYLFPDVSLTVCDFYDSELHTEVSIERARKIYPSYKGTVKVDSSNLPFKNREFDIILVFMAAHEIRDEEERLKFFQELSRVTSPKGEVYVTEHLRDFNNFLAFTFGFFHFYSKESWERIFSLSKFRVGEERKTTPFISTFILKHYGTTN